ncbi:MAG: carbohydrate ABC transporter permease [Candidatus Omnitrophota bacterium]|jgi:multiple sugar transport system permease protein/raffinose/stachyose/melibiose transport system permease protein
MISKYKVIRGVKAILIHAFLLIVTITCLFPLFWMTRSALMSNDTIFTDKSLIPAEIHFNNFVKAWTQGHFAMYSLNSIIYTFSVVVGIVVISSLAAYAFSRLEFPGKNFFFYMFVMAMMIPLPGSFVPLTVLMTKLGFINSPYPFVRQLGYVLCMINVGLSLSILLLKTFFDKMPPDLEDAARIDGCSKLGIWRHVALPLARPAIAVIVIFNALNVWNEYILAMLLLNDIPNHPTIMPLQRGLVIFQGTYLSDYPLLMAGLTIAAAPIIVVYLLMQKHIIKGLSSGAVVG